MRSLSDTGHTSLNTARCLSKSSVLHCLLYAQILRWTDLPTKSRTKCLQNHFCTRTKWRYWSSTVGLNRFEVGQNEAYIWGNKEWVEHFSLKNSVEKTTWKTQTSANMEEEQQWKLGDGTTAYVSRTGFCKQDAEKYISTFRLTKFNNRYRTLRDVIRASYRLLLTERNTEP